MGFVDLLNIWTIVLCWLRDMYEARAISAVM